MRNLSNTVDGDIYFKAEEMSNIDTGLWNLHRECVSKKKNDIDEFSQKLKSDIRKRHAAMLFEEDYNLTPERDSDSICACGVINIELFIWRSKLMVLCIRCIS